MKEAQSANNTNAAVIGEKIPVFEGVVHSISFSPNSMTRQSQKVWVTAYQPNCTLLEGIFKHATDGFKTEMKPELDQIWQATIAARVAWKGPFDFKLAELIGGVWDGRSNAMTAEDLSETDATRLVNGFKADHEMLMWMVEAHDCFIKVEGALGCDSKIRESVALFLEVAQLGARIGSLHIQTGDDTYLEALKEAAESARLVKLQHARVPLGDFCGRLPEVVKSWAVLAEMLKVSATAVYGAQQDAFQAKLLNKTVHWPAEHVDLPNFPGLELDVDVARITADLPRHEEALDVATALANVLDKHSDITELTVASAKDIIRRGIAACSQNSLGWMDVNSLDEAALVEHDNTILKLDSLFKSIEVFVNIAKGIGQFGGDTEAHLRFVRASRRSSSGSPSFGQAARS